MDIASFILGYKKGIASAGSGETVDPVHTVTFMSEDGSTVLYQRSVVDGDTCADVVARGLLDTPTKESTAQYTYTYSGWALTSGGAASASALSAVTEDRTVYAAYTSAVRYYTITYYDADGTTVLKTESKAYGSSLSYTPEKDGLNFEGWTPELATVTGNAAYVAEWSEALTFAGASWADIAAISEAGEAANYFKIGDTREIALSNGDTITVAIAGFNHDTLASDSGSTAGLSIVCMSVPSYTSQWSSVYNDYTFYGYATSYMRVNYLNGTILNALPSELTAVIKPVIKKADQTNSSGTSKGYTTVTDTLWALSLDELGHSSAGTSNISALGSRYELFTSGTITSNVSPILESVTKTDTGDICNTYWTRHHHRIGTCCPYYVTHTDFYGNVGKGSAAYAQASSTAIQSTYRYIRFGFCI